MKTPPHVRADTGWGGAHVCERCGRREPASVLGTGAAQAFQRFAARHRDCSPRPSHCPTRLYHRHTAPELPGAPSTTETTR